MFESMILEKYLSQEGCYVMKKSVIYTVKSRKMHCAGEATVGGGHE